MFADEAFRFSRQDWATEAPWNHLGSGHREAAIVEAAQSPQSTGVNPVTARVIVHLLRNCAVYQFHDTSDSSSFKKRWDIEDNSNLRTHGGNLAAVLHRLEHEDNRRFESICRHITRVLPVFDRARRELRQGHVEIEGGDGQDLRRAPHIRRIAPLLRTRHPAEPSPRDADVLLASRNSACTRWRCPDRQHDQGDLQDNRDSVAASRAYSSRRDHRAGSSEARHFAVSIPTPTRLARPTASPRGSFGRRPSGRTSVIRLAISVEGPTEEEFSKNVLTTHLRAHGIEAQPVVLRARSRGAGGGNVVWGDSAGNGECMVHSTLSSDSETSVIKTAEELEAVRGQVQQKVGWNRNGVLPYVQKHEFESLRSPMQAPFRLWPMHLSSPST